MLPSTIPYTIYQSLQRNMLPSAATRHSPPRPWQKNAQPSSSVIPNELLYPGPRRRPALHDVVTPLNILPGLSQRKALPRASPLRSARIIASPYLCAATERAIWLTFVRTATAMPMTAAWITKRIWLCCEPPVRRAKLIIAAPQIENEPTLHHLGPKREAYFPTIGFNAAGKSKVNKTRPILVGVHEYCRITYSGMDFHVSTRIT